MNFVKMEGLGNDFIITHEISAGTVQSVAKQAIWLCNRRRGIGGDGIIFVLPSSRADFKMRIINSDGSEAEMCGNGIRCFAHYVREMRLTDLSHLTIETASGNICTEIISDEMVKVNMGSPKLEAKSIPVVQNSGRVISKNLDVGDRSFTINAISMGNPHAVIYADELTDQLVASYGSLIEHHPFFPKRTNVEFVKVQSTNEISMRVWERGCGETQACGTGACAAVVSGIINKLHGTDIQVHLPGGDLHVQWSGDESDPVFMTGPAKRVYDGKIEVKL